MTITGRLKDVIIRHGENISAKEVEDLLYAHPAVADVAVIGLPDPKTGERACAVVAVKEGQSFEFDDMSEYLEGTDCGSTPFPSSSNWWTTVPRNPAGKILKHTLRETYRRLRNHRERTNEPDPTGHIGSRWSGARCRRRSMSTHTGRRFTDMSRWSPGPVPESVGRWPCGWPAKGLWSPPSTWPRTSGRNRRRDLCRGGDGHRLPLRRHLGVSVAEPWRRWSRAWGPERCCNVAGIGGFFNTADMPLDRWEQILAVNLTGPFLVCRATLPHLLDPAVRSSTWPPTPP